MQINKEFEVLKTLIDFDQAHQQFLHDCNDNCRYMDIKPYKYNNVELFNKKFINASWIDFPKYHEFIATQGPMKFTCEDFFNMCIQNNVNLIIMLCKDFENGREKCYTYWEEQRLNSIIVKEGSSKKVANDLILREIVLEGHWFQKKKIYQLHYVGWPDHGAPDPTKAYGTFIKMFNYTKELGKAYPVVGHCSAGVGRTGTYLTLFNIYEHLKQQKLNKRNYYYFSVFIMVRKLKEMRLFLVENEFQYKFIYNLLDLIIKQLN